MKLPFSISPLFLFAVICLIASPSHLNAQAVTWGATGLPPGMTVTNSGTNAVKITGTPTKVGNYTAIIFPKIGNFTGDMVTVPISVQPQGTSLPVYYAYNRRVTNGTINGIAPVLVPLVGGSGYLLIAAMPDKLLFTTNGTTFTQSALPSGSQLFRDGLPQAAIVGSRCLLCGGGEMDYCDNQGSFKKLSFPRELVNNTNDNTWQPWPWQSSISSGSNFFYYAFSGYNETNKANCIKIFCMQNNTTNWTSKGSFNLPKNISSFQNIAMSVAVNSSLLVMAIQGNSLPGLLLSSTNNGDTWTTNNSNPGIMSVTYGNGIFLGTGNGGVWKSTNGINWTQTSTTYVGNITYSSTDGCFFSVFSGISKDGIYWMPYGQGATTFFSSIIASSGTGVIFLPSGQQLSTTFIPSFYADNRHLLNVGTVSSFTLQLDSAGSGSISQ